ncbi:MAG: hypothetical protein WCS62_05070 [Bacilli bacterium]
MGEYMGLAENAACLIVSAVGAPKSMTVNGCRPLVIPLGICTGLFAVRAIPDSSCRAGGSSVG